MSVMARIIGGLMLAYSALYTAHSDVVWMVIAVLIPLVLATTGWRLWRESG